MAGSVVPPVEGPDGQGGPHVFVDDLDDPALTAADRHHLERVLRLRAGDSLTVSDGKGSWRPCRYGVPLEPVGEVLTTRRREPVISVAFTPVKGDRPEWVAQKLTELGVDRIVVLRADRSVVRWEGERGARQMARLERVVREAAMQCRRCRLPEISGVADIGDVVAGGGVARADRGGPAPTLERPVVLIGPEGGWSDAERDAAPESVGLGEFVLRAETAAVTAGALLTALRGQWARRSEA